MTFLVIPSGDYRSESGALANASKTEIFAAEHGGAFVVGLRIVNSTGSVTEGVTTHIQLTTGDTERIFDYHTTAIDEYGLVVEGFPIVLGPGGTIDLTGGSGHHWYLTYLPRGVGIDSIAQITSVAGAANIPSTTL